LSTEVQSLNNVKPLEDLDMDSDQSRN